MQILVRETVFGIPLIGMRMEIMMMVIFGIVHHGQMMEMEYLILMNLAVGKTIIPLEIMNIVVMIWVMCFLIVAKMDFVLGMRVILLQMQAKEMDYCNGIVENWMVYLTLEMTVLDVKQKNLTILMVMGCGIMEKHILMII